MTRRTTDRLVSPVEGWDEVIVTHSDCVCNEMRALHHRHQKMAPRPSEVGVRRLRTKARELFLVDGVERVVPKKREQVLSHYAGRQLAEFKRALESLKERPVCARDAEVKMFLKDDKYVEGYAKIKAPRCIQYRDKRYCLELARYLQIIEGRVYGAVDRYGHRLIAKGRNLNQRGGDLAAKATEFSSPLFLLLDASNFDAHVDSALLKVEHDIYIKSTKKSARGALKWLLARQLVNKGRTKNGTTYVTPGTRMSGDMNTGLGNSILMAAMLESYLDDSGVEGAVYVDGDDSVVIIDAAHQGKLLPVAPYFESFGMEMKLEITDEFSKVDFCQCRPVNVDGHWVLCRDPSRVMVRPLWTTRVMGEKLAGRYLKGLGLGEVAVNWGLPLGAALGKQLYELGEGKPWAFEYHPGMKMREYGRLDSPDPSDATRMSYYEAWGIPPDEQEAVERSIRSISRANTSMVDALRADTVGPGYDRR
jgi:hypothetical protein